MFRFKFKMRGKRCVPRATNCIHMFIILLRVRAYGARAIILGVRWHDTCVRFTPIRARKSRFFAQRMNHATEVWKIDTRPAMGTSQLANLNSIPTDRIKKVWEWGAGWKQMKNRGLYQSVTRLRIFTRVHNFYREIREACKHIEIYSFYAGKLDRVNNDFFHSYAW